NNQQSERHPNITARATSAKKEQRSHDRSEGPGMWHEANCHGKQHKQVSQHNHLANRLNDFGPPTARRQVQSGVGCSPCTKACPRLVQRDPKPSATTFRSRSSLTAARNIFWPRRSG